MDVVAAFDVQELTLELVELLGVCAELRGAQRGKLALKDLKVAGQTILLDCQRVRAVGQDRHELIAHTGKCIKGKYFILEGFEGVAACGEVLHELIVEVGRTVAAELRLKILRGAQMQDAARGLGLALREHRLHALVRERIAEHLAARGFGEQIFLLELVAEVQKLERRFCQKRGENVERRPVAEDRDDVEYLQFIGRKAARRI